MKKKISKKEQMLIIALKNLLDKGKIDSYEITDLGYEVTNGKVHSENYWDSDLSECKNVRDFEDIILWTLKVDSQ